VKWDSSNRYKGDNTQTSVLFTLTNPHNIPPRRFAVIAERKENAIIVIPVDGVQYLALAVTFPFQTIVMQTPVVTLPTLALDTSTTLDCLGQHFSLAHTIAQ
jgi:hypothetical protein